MFNKKFQTRIIPCYMQIKERKKKKKRKKRKKEDELFLQLECLYNNCSELKHLADRKSTEVSDYRWIFSLSLSLVFLGSFKAFPFCVLPPPRPLSFCFCFLFLLLLLLLLLILALLVNKINAT